MEGISMLLDNITLAYGEKVVARNITAELLPGELVCLIGRNGCGKSTLIRYLAKPNKKESIVTKPNKEESIATKPNKKEAIVAKPNKGETIAAKPNKKESIVTKPNKGGSIEEKPEGKAEKGAESIALVLTDRIDAEGMRVEDVVALGRAPYTGFFGVMSDRDWEIVNAAMDELGVGELRGRFVNTLSDGERQKVMIAKALAQQTPYILLDEPTAFLDYPTKVDTMKLLQRLCKEQGKAVLISTHDLDIALRYCDRVWEMGRIESGEWKVESGSAKRLSGKRRECWREVSERRAKRVESASAEGETCSTLRVITPEEARERWVELKIDN